MISPTTLAAAAKVAEHSARRSSPWGVDESPWLEQRVAGAPVAESQDPAAPGCVPILGLAPRDGPLR